MNAVPEVEKPEAGARRLFSREIAAGFVPVALHCYADAGGTPLFYRPRLKHPDGRKAIKPIRLDGLRYVMGEPPAPQCGKPLYRLPDLLADITRPVWIVEGEACADALAKLGLIATTSGSADSARGADWTPLRGRHCVVWPDHDAAGAKYARAVAGILRGMGATVELVDVSVLALPDKGDCCDWLAAHPGATLADVEALPRGPMGDTPSASPLARTEPEPLRRPVPPPEPYPLAALGPTLASVAESLRRVIQAPDAVCGASVLAAASLAAQGLANVEREPGHDYPLSLWFLTVANSGERKSAVDAEALKAARAWEKELTAIHEAEQHAHAALLAEWEARRDAAKAQAKKAKGEGLASLLQDLGPAPPAPLTPRVLVADFTAEGLAKLLVAGFPSVGAFTDEAALVFGGHGFTNETAMRTAGTLSKLWDNGTLDRVRASEGAVKLYGRRLALHLLAQPVIAERALSDDVLSGQGFLARCLLAWPESTAGSRPYLAESLSSDVGLIRYSARLAALHREPLPLAQDTRQELQPRILRLSPDAKALWVRFHDGIEAAMKPGARFATVQAWASKSPEQALRIAGVLTLVDNPHAQHVDADTIERAAELALWHLNEAARLAGTAELSREVRDAEALLNWCHETGRALLYSTDALNKGPARIREREPFTQAAGELVRAGWAEPVEGGAVVDGKHRRHVWRIVPKPAGC